MLQTLAVKYSKGDRSMDMVVKAMRERARCIGNGWTVDVIAHILKSLT